MTRLLITLCTYNERENIELLVPEIQAVAPDAELLIIDDNSPDGTGQVAQTLADATSRIHVLHRPRKDGLGAATVAGFRYAIEHQYDLLINLDADFSHNPRFIPELLARAAESDVVIGSRYVAGGGVTGWTLKRKIMSRLINAWARLLLGLKTWDNSGSYRCYRVACLAQIEWKRTVSRGYAFQEEVLYRLRRAGCSFSESPILFEDRRFGTTKINLKESLSAVRDIFRLGLQNLRGCPVRVDFDSAKSRT